MTVNSDGSLVSYPTINVGGTCTKKTMPIVFMLVVVFLLSMWDVYVPQLGLRVLDFVGVGLLCFWILWKLAVDMRGPAFRTRNIQLLALMIAWSLVLSVVGFMGSMENIKPIAGILMGVVVFGYFYSIRLDDRSVVKVLSILIVIHASYLIIQYLYYQVFGIVLNIYAFLGTEPRALSSIFRPTGLFLEPASYSVSMLMLLSLRMFITMRFDVISYLAMGTIFLTLSVWGLIAVIIFLVVFMRKNAAFLVAVAVAAVLIAFYTTEIDWTEVLGDTWISERLMNIGEDSSATTRYGALVGYGTNTIAPTELWFGKGINNEYHDFGSSGLAFLLSAGGLVGAVFFLLLLLALTPQGRRFVALTLILLFMTAAPMWTMAYWWFCLALMTRSLERRVAD